MNIYLSIYLSIYSDCDFAMTDIEDFDFYQVCIVFEKCLPLMCLKRNTTL